VVWEYDVERRVSGSYSLNAQVSGLL
jgi:hypothetical protein